MSNVLGGYLDPIDALSTIFFSILFALLFTLTYGILIQRGVIDRTFTTGYGQELFVSILGAVAAWGIVDGVVYLLTSVFARNERIRLLHVIQTSDDDETAVSAVADDLDFILEPITSDAQREELYQDIREQLQSAEPQTLGLRREDLTGATAAVLLSVVAVLPSLLPLLLLDDTAQAIRLSNLVSTMVIFATGYVWGIHTGTNPWKTGLLLACICLGMVFVAILLGG